MSQILSIIGSLLSVILLFFKKDKRKEEIVRIKDKQVEVDFQSKVEEIVKAAESKDENVKNNAVNDVRVLLSE